MFIMVLSQHHFFLNISVLLPTYLQPFFHLIRVQEDVFRFTWTEITEETHSEYCTTDTTRLQNFKPIWEIGTSLIVWSDCVQLTECKSCRKGFKEFPPGKKELLHRKCYHHKWQRCPIRCASVECHQKMWSRGYQ